MPKISAKRQITLPIEQCRDAGIEPGDEYSSYVGNEGHITIIKKVAGAAKGLLSSIDVNLKYSDEDSLQSCITP
jgi:bifunctional DNA-binding transcriptional regulator/antitoxin component of YhaV-PrlF toxin-antitoxin module